MFDAYVTKKSGQNYFLTATQGEAITDEKANTIEIYNAATTLDEKLKKNAKITVKMILKNYHGQVENLLALTADDITVVTEGGNWNVAEHNVTVAEGLQVINGLADGATTEDLYVFTEVYVKEVTGAYNEQYGNMNFTIADTANGTDTITVFRAKTTAAVAATVVAGAQVTIKGNLQKYVKNETMTPELLNVDGITVKGATPVDNTITVAQALTTINGLEDGATTTESYKLSEVYVTEVTDAYNSQYGNMSFKVADTANGTDVLTVFRAKTTAEIAATVVAGAQVTIEGKLQKYVKNNVMTPEMTGVLSITVKGQGGGGGEGGGGGDQTNYGTAENPLSMAQALTIAEGLAQGAATSQVVYARGVITTAVDNSGSYIKSFTVKDATDAAKTLLVYSCNKNAQLGDPAQNDTITICGYIKNYNGTLEFTTNNNTYVTFTALTRGTSAITSTANQSTITGLAASGTNGSTISFTVAANSGYQVDAVKVYGKAITGNNGSYSFTLLGDANVVVETSVEGTVQNPTVEFTADNSCASAAAFTLTKNPITLSCNNGVVNAEQIRIYKGKTLTISGATIVKVEFTCTAEGTAQYGPGCFTTPTGTYSYSGSIGTWTGSASSIVFTAESNQVRCTSIVVTYVAA